MSVHLAKPEHEAFYQDLCALLKKHCGALPLIEALAVAANMVGKLVAMQDQRVITPEVAMKVVVENIQAGNQMVFDAILQSEGTA